MTRQHALAAMRYWALKWKKQRQAWNPDDELGPLQMACFWRDVARDMEAS